MKIGCFRIFAKKETEKPEFVDLTTRYKYNVSYHTIFKKY